MVPQNSILVALLMLIERIPLPEPPVRPGLAAQALPGGRGTSHRDRCRRSLDHVRLARLD